MFIFCEFRRATYPKFNDCSFAPNRYFALWLKTSANIFEALWASFSMGMIPSCFALRARFVSTFSASEMAAKLIIAANMPARIPVIFLPMISILFAAVLHVGDRFHPFNVLTVFHSRDDAMRHCRGR
jgi:hypothetical protein